MANRVLAGNHPSYGYGLFVSKPGVNVLTASESNLIYDSRTYRSGIIYQTFSPSTTANFTWTSSSLGYIPAVIASGARPENYFEVEGFGSGEPTFTVDFQTPPFVELTETTINDKGKLPRGNLNSNVHQSNFFTTNIYGFLRFPCHYGKMGSSTLFGTSSDTFPASSTATDRVLIGNHPTYGQGMFISRPGVNVTTASADQFIFNTSSTVGANLSSIIKVQSVTLTRASSNSSSANDQTITYSDTGSVPGVEIRVPSGAYSQNGVEIISQSSTAITLRLPRTIAQGSRSSENIYRNPSSLTVTVLVIKRG